MSRFSLANLAGWLGRRRPPPDEDQRRNTRRLLDRYGVRWDPVRVLQDAEIRALPVSPGSAVLMAHLAVAESEAAARYALEHEEVARLSVRAEVTTAHRIASHQPALFGELLRRPHLLLLTERGNLTVLESALLSHPQLGLQVLEHPEILFLTAPSGLSVLEIATLFSPPVARRVRLDEELSRQRTSRGLPLGLMAERALATWAALESEPHRRGGPKR